MARYRRPARCRLCGFPASDGAVPVSELDADKLSKWCLRTMDTELDPRKAAEAVFCRFCVAEARLEADHSGLLRTERNEINWWNTDQLMDVTWNYFFLGGQVRPCAVKINTLSDRILKKYRAQIEETKRSVRGPAPRRRHIQNCIFCSDKFYTKFSLQQHIESTHGNVEKYHCSRCSIYFSSKATWNEHREQFHKASFKCGHCNKLFRFEANLRQHETMFHDQKNENSAEVKQKVRICKCFYCQQVVDPRSLHQHVRSHHPKMVNLRCTSWRCGKYFHAEEDKLAHFQQEHQGAPFLCKQCDKKFVSKSWLQRHMKNVHNSPIVQPDTQEKPARELERSKKEQKVEDTGQSKVLKCSICFKMVSKDRWAFHKRYQHNDNKVEKCIYCPFVSKTYPIANHIRLYHKLESIKCRKRCASFFLTTEERDQHEQVYHTKKRKKKVGSPASKQVKSTNSGKPLKRKTMASSSGEANMVLCGFCPTKVKHRNMATHLTEKHGLEVIRCTMKSCPAYFMTEEERDQHYSQLHIKVRIDLQCFFCDKVFFRKDSLIDHVRRKHEEKTIFNCLVRRCSAFFSNSADREDHMTKEHAQYTKADWIKCSKCNFQTTQVSYLNMHTSRKHSILSFKCPECPKRFKSEEIQKRHKIYAHKIEKQHCTYCKKLIFNLFNHQKKIVCTICGHSSLCLASHRYHKMSCK